MNKGRSVYFLLIVLFNTLYTFADKQGSVAPKVLQNRVGISIGYNLGLLEDVNYSPLNYRENGMAFLLDFTHETKNNSVLILADAAIGPDKITSAYSDYFTADKINFDLDISILKKIAFKRIQNLFIALGAQYSFNGNFINYEDMDAFSFLFSNDIAFKGQIEFKKGKQTFKFSGAAPFAAFISRPPYNGQDKELSDNQDRPLKIIADGKWCTLNKYHAFETCAEYTYQLSRRFELVGQYLVHYEHVKGTNHLISLQNQILAGVIFSF